ncbi:hypothetical protein V6N13_147980 [Hibiscus sabdariffa]
MASLSFPFASFDNFCLLLVCAIPSRKLARIAKSMSFWTVNYVSLIEIPAQPFKIQFLQSASSRHFTVDKASEAFNEHARPN